MSEREHAVIIGASSGVGRHLAEALAARGSSLTLVSRDIEDISATAADVRLRFDVPCTALALDIGHQGFDPHAFAASCETNGPVKHLLVPAGSNTAADHASNPDVIDMMMRNNYLGPARIAAVFGGLMAKRGKGSIVLFSSIASAAPRSRNGAYSSAKAALEVYAKALRTDLEPRGVNVAVIRLGYVDTRLSFGMPLLFPVASPQKVAAYVVARILGHRGRVHYPRFWGLITLLLQHLPWFLYRRLPF